MLVYILKCIVNSSLICAHEVIGICCICITGPYMVIAS